MLQQVDARAGVSALLLSSLLLPSQCCRELLAEGGLVLGVWETGESFAWQISASKPADLVPSLLSPKSRF